MSLTDLSRRDDMIALGYMLLYMMSGTLPWLDPVTNERKMTVKAVGEVKNRLSTVQLCESIKSNKGLFGTLLIRIYLMIRCDG